MHAWRKALFFSLAAVFLSIIPAEKLLYGDVPANHSPNSSSIQPDTFTPRAADIFNFDKWYPRLNLDQKTSDDRSLGRVSLMYPLWQNTDKMIFSDIRIVFDDNDSFETNFGGGYRRIIRNLSDDSKGWIWGLYGFFDRRKTPHDNYFNQGTFGAEILSNNFEVRFNYYLPGRDSHVAARRNSFTGTGLSGTVVVDNFGVLEAREYALPGFDVEAGYGFDIGEKGKLWLYAGYFNFDRNQTPKISGPRGRIRYEIKDAFGLADTILALGFEIRKDEIRGTDNLFTIGFSIPLGSPPARAKGYHRSIDSRMMRPVVRDVDVKSFSQDINKTVGSEGGPHNAGTQQVPVRDASGNVINLYFVDGGAGGDGTQTSPMTAAEADAAAGESDVVFLLNDAGTINTNTTLNIEENGQLLGTWGSNTRNISLVGGRTISATSSAGVPTLNNTNPAQDVVVVDSGARVEGLYITGGKIGIVGTGTGAAPIQGLNVKDVWINDVAGAGMSFDYLSGTADFQDVWLANTGTIGAQAVYLNNTPAAAAVTFDNISIGAAGETSVASIGIDLRNTAGTVSFAQTTVENASGSRGVNVLTVAGSGSVNFDGLTIGHLGGAGGGAFFVDNVGSNATVSCTGTTTISASHTVGIGVFDVLGTAEFGDVTVAQSDQMGIYLYRNTGTISFGQTSVDNLVYTGIRLWSNTGAVSFGDTTVTNWDTGITGKWGIDLQNNTGGTVSFGATTVGVTTVPAGIKTPPYTLAAPNRLSVNANNTSEISFE